MTALRNIFFIVLIALLSACSEKPKDTGVLKENQNTVESQLPDKNMAAYIGPANATAQTIITLKTNNPEANNGDIHWYVNGDEVLSSKDFRLTYDELKKGDIVQAIIVSGDNKFQSNELTIKNTPPVILKAEFVPSMPEVSDTVQPNIKSDDVDKDNITFKYHWTLNGAFAGEDSYLKAGLRRDDKIAVEVTPYDGEEYGRSVRLESRVYNSLPAVTESSPSFDGKIYKYHIAATDPDNDKLTFKLEKGPKGMAVDPSSGDVTWEVKPEDKGRHEIRVLVSDNNGGAIIVPITARISLEE
ncbi:MAG: cadherin repeat domain-containing protein [Nitrospirae bacterium]|nr:cadherin repeat domain-containing protein [Nitrospirota bacterium]